MHIIIIFKMSILLSYYTSYQEKHYIIKYTLRSSMAVKVSINYTVSFTLHEIFLARQVKLQETQIPSHHCPLIRSGKKIVVSPNLSSPPH